MNDKNILVFSKNDDNNYTVSVNDTDAGELARKNSEWYFTYNSENGFESIEYYDSLQETREQLQREFNDGLKDDSAIYFGSYKY